MGVNIQKQIVSMIDQHILDESIIDGSYQLRLKIKYLQEDKEKLEISCREMTESIRLMRSINKQLSKGVQISEQTLFNSMSEQCSLLQKACLRLQEENYALSCECLMHKQILSESEAEAREIMKSYEAKIIELRRSIQFKESCIQSYEQNNGNGNNAFELGNIPPSNVSMIMFTEIDEHKETIQKMSRQNKQLKKENQSLNRKAQQLESEIEFVKQLFASDCSLREVRSAYQFSQSPNQVRVRSASKKDLIRLAQENSKTEKNLNIPQETRETSYQSNRNLSQLKDLIKTKNRECAKLQAVLRKQKNQRRAVEEKLKLCLKSNKFYKEKRVDKTDQINYYKKCTSDLLDLIAKSKVKRPHSAQKDALTQFVSTITKPSEVRVSQDRKKIWMKMAEELKPKSSSQEKRIILKNLFSKKLKRSFSDVLTYRDLWSETQKIEHYFLKQKTSSQQVMKSKDVQKNESDFKVPEGVEEQSKSDFSCMLSLGPNGQIFDEESLIIKPKVMTYSERKRAKAKKGSSSKMNDLTIIQENIL